MSRLIPSKSAELIFTNRSSHRRSIECVAKSKSRKSSASGACYSDLSICLDLYHDEAYLGVVQSNLVHGSAREYMPESSSSKRKDVCHVTSNSRDGAKIGIPIR